MIFTERMLIHGHDMRVFPKDLDRFYTPKIVEFSVP